VIPGEEAFAAVASRQARCHRHRGEAAARRSRGQFELSSWSLSLVDPHFGHQTAEVLGVVGQVVEVGGVEVVGARRNTAGIPGLRRAIHHHPSVMELVV